MRIKKLGLAVLLAVAGPFASTAHAVPVQWTVASGGNGHWYDLIYAADGGGFTWDEAFADASTRSYLGMPGYLATITSAAEQAFVASNFSDTAWLGGTDRDLEGVWKWVTGPEAGQIFYGPGAPAGAYSNWAAIEPNNCCGGENELVVNWIGDSWNDIGTPAFPDYRVPYIIEFGGLDEDPSPVPEPVTLGLLAAGLVPLAIRRRRAGTAAS